MQILKPAVAGTLESSDLMVTLEPGSDGIELSLTSSVMNQYGRQIKKTVLETLERLEVKDAKVTVVDRARWTAPSRPAWNAPCCAAATRPTRTSIGEV